MRSSSSSSSSRSSSTQASLSLSKFLSVLLVLVLFSTRCLVKGSIIVLTNNMTYADHAAAFGPRLSENGKLGFLIEPEQDPTGCSPVTVVEKPFQEDYNENNWIALVRRGGCSFITKVRSMQKSGATAVVVGDPDHPGRWITMYAPGDTSDVLIPSVFLAQEEYLALLSLARAGPIPIRLELDDFISWPLIDVLIIVVISPTILLVLIYISWRIRQRQKRRAELADVKTVNKLTIKKFNRQKIRENEREECAICLEDYMEGDSLRVLPCQHDFHAQCVDAWLTTQKKFCPICKACIERLPCTQQQHEREPLLPIYGTVPNSERMV